MYRLNPTVRNKDIVVIEKEISSVKLRMYADLLINKNKVNIRKGSLAELLSKMYNDKRFYLRYD